MWHAVIASFIALSAMCGGLPARPATSDNAWEPFAVIVCAWSVQLTRNLSVDPLPLFLTYMQRVRPVAAHRVPLLRAGAPGLRGGPHTGHAHVGDAPAATRHAALPGRGGGDPLVLCGHLLAPVVYDMVRTCSLAIAPTNFCTEIGLWTCKFCTPLYCL